MYKFIKGALIFTSGLTVGAGVITVAVLSSRDIRNVISRKIVDAILCEEHSRPCSYKPHYYRTHERKVYAEDIIIDSCAEAEKILNEMVNVISKCGKISVADYKDLCGIVPEIMDTKYGWTDLSNVDIVDVDRGFAINLPRLKELK